MKFYRNGMPYDERTKQVKIPDLTGHITTQIITRHVTLKTYLHKLKTIRYSICLCDNKSEPNIHHIRYNSMLLTDSRTEHKKTKQSLTYA